MSKKIFKPRRPPTDDKKRGWSYILPVVWDGVFWEIWAKAPKRHLRKQYPQIKFFARDGAPSSSSFYFLWHPVEKRFIRAGHFHTMADHHPAFLERLQGLLAKEHDLGNVPGTDSFKGSKDNV